MLRATPNVGCFSGALFVTFAATSALAQAEPSHESAEAATADLSLVNLLDTEVVSASRNEESLARAPAVIDVITQSEMRARGYRTVGAALQSIAGLDVTSDHYQDSVGVRGVGSGARGYSRIVKVMLDGQPVSFRPSGENFLGVALLPIGVIERIEVIRGPGSALYGANAFLGVVNIITRSGYDLNGNSLTLAYEGGDKVSSPFGEAVVAQQLNDFSILLAAAEETSQLDGYRLVPLPGRRHPQADRESVTEALPSSSAYGRVAYDSERFGTLSLDAHFQRLYRSAEFTDWGVLNHGNRLELRNGFVRLAYRADLGEAWSLALSGALSRGGVGNDDRLDVAPRTPHAVERELSYWGHDVGGVATYHLTTASWASLGFDASWDDQTPLAHYAVGPSGDLTLNPPSGTATSERSFRNLGVYGNTTLYPFSKLSRALGSLGLTAGGRYDAHNIYGNAWNGRAGLVYDVAERHFAKLLYGTSFRAPSSTQLFSNVIVPGGVAGNPELRPERARTVELALGATPIRYLTLRVDGYYTVISDRVEIRRPSETTARNNPVPTNSTPITSKGFEAQLDFQASALRAFLSYSFQNSDYPREDLLAIDRREVRVQTDGYPAHSIKGGVTLTHRPWYLRAHIEGRYVGARVGSLDNNALVHPLDFLTARYRLPAYGLLDVALSSVGVELWQGHESVLLGKISNLLDTRYQLPGYAGFDIPGFQRSYTLSLQQEL